MGLTSEDRRWVEDAMRSSEERTYKRIPVIEGELREMNASLQAIRDHLGA